MMPCLRLVVVIAVVVAVVVAEPGGRSPTNNSPEHTDFFCQISISRCFIDGLIIFTVHLAVPHIAVDQAEFASRPWRC